MELSNELRILERAATVFGQDTENSQEKERRAELERFVGRLTMEVDILKKASHLLGPSKQRNV